MNLESRNFQRKNGQPVNLPLRQLNGSNSARQLIGSNFFQFFRKVQSTLNSFVNVSPLFFSRTLGNLMVPKRPAINWFQIFEKSTIILNSFGNCHRYLWTGSHLASSRKEVDAEF